MNRIHITLCLLLFALTANAQTESHLQFKGIPIDGNYKAFVQKLVQKGFTIEDSSEEVILLKGTFMARPKTVVVVYADPTSKVVSVVAAMLEAGSNWPDIETDYFNTVDTYKEKYGVPSNHEEVFTTRLISDDDYWRLDALEEGNCNYQTKWITDCGEIKVTLAFFDFKYYVCCIYKDAENAKALHQTVMDDI